MQQERPDFNIELPWIDNIIGEDDGHADLDPFHYLKNDGFSAEFARQQISPPRYTLLRDNSQGANVDAGRDGSCKYHETLDFDSYRSPPTASCRHTDSLQAFLPASCTNGTPNHDQVEMLIRHGTDHIATTCASAIACPCDWQADFMHNGAGDSLRRFDTVMSAQSPSCWVDKAAMTAWLPADHRELLYHTAAMQPVEFSGIRDNIASATAGIKPQRNIRISKDPQSVAARQRRRRISEKIRVLQRLVPGAAKLDTAEMLEEAAQYVKFLRAEVEKMEAMEDWMRLKAAAGPNLIDMHVAASHQSPPSICLSAIQRL